MLVALTALSVPIVPTGVPACVFHVTRDTFNLKLDKVGAWNVATHTQREQRKQQQHVMLFVSASMRMFSWAFYYSLVFAS